MSVIKNKHKRNESLWNTISYMDENGNIIKCYKLDELGHLVDKKMNRQPRRKLRDEYIKLCSNKQIPSIPNIQSEALTLNVAQQNVSNVNIEQNVEASNTQNSNMQVFQNNNTKIQGLHYISIKSSNEISSYKILK